MQYDKLLEVLARGDVKELALQTDRPACVLIGDQYTPVMQRNLTEDDIIGVAIEAGGRTEVLQLLSGPRRWDFEHATMGTLRIFAGYHGPKLQVRVKLVQAAAPKAPQATPARAAMPQAPSRPEPPPAPPREPPLAEAKAGAGATRGRPNLAPPDVPRKPAAAAVSAPNPLEFDSPVARARTEAVDFGDMPPLMGGTPQQRPPTMDREPQNGAPRRSPSLTFDKPIAKGGGDDLFGGDDGMPAAEPGLDELTIPQDSEPPPRAEAAARRASAANFAPAPDAPPRAEPVARRASAANFVAAPTGSPDAEFQRLLKLARDKQASDLHIVGDRPVMLRVGGDLVQHSEPLPAAFVEQMLMAQLPERARADLATHGACDFSLIHPTLGRFRANATRMRTGMKLTARPIGEAIPTLADLGLPESISAATEHHQGLIVVTGPTGHGKTTTLAAIVDIVNRTRSHHVITVEDPIEYVHPRKMAMMSQREVGTHTKTFAAALKGSLREDPDVIVVGELRDTDTVRMALSASETGHLVISTMNTPSAAKAIERIIDLFPPGDQPQVRMTLAGGLRLVVSQRLVPSADRKSLHAAAELLPGSSALWALIRDNKTFQIPSLQQRGKALGIIRLDDSLADLVREGKTSIEIAREFAESPDQFEALVKGVPARPADQQFTAANIDPAREASQAAQKFGKDMFAKAGKLFGGEKK